MMTLVLQNWDNVISKIVNPTAPGFDSFTDECLQSILSELPGEEEKIRIRFLEGMMEKSRIKDKLQFVRLNHALGVQLLDKIYLYNQDYEVNQNIHYLYNSLSIDLQNILYFIEYFFGNYIDRNNKLPKIQANVAISKLGSRFKELSMLFQVKENIGEDLKDILKNNFQFFFSQAENGITYYELSYQEELMNELLSGDVMESESSLNDTLFYLNFNNNAYVAFIQKRIKALVESISEQSEQIINLRLQQKNINQLRTRINSFLSRQVPSLKKQINLWIEEEIKFLQYDIVHHDTCINSAVTQNVHVPFKGSEIYLLNKSFIDSGGAPAETYKSLLEKISAHLSNKNQKGFSTESLQKASDKLTPQSKENVKRFLQKIQR